jgi:hypothetical protein
MTEDLGTRLDESRQILAAGEVGDKPKQNSETVLS